MDLSRKKKKSEWELVVEALVKLGGIANLDEIVEEITNSNHPERKINPDPKYKKSIYDDLVMLSVNNPSRVNHGRTLTYPRRTNIQDDYDKVYKYDIDGDILYEIYSPEKHGVWEIFEDGIKVSKKKKLIGEKVPKLSVRRCPSGVDEIEADKYALLEMSDEEVELFELLHPTEKRQFIKIRTKQKLFRDNVLKLEKCCRITGITNPKLLIASHIKPWGCCNDMERIDGNNGLMLIPNFDKLFDKGYISFEDNGRIKLADFLTEKECREFNIDSSINVGVFNPQQSVYLKYHRDTIFNKKTQNTIQNF